VLIDNVLSRDGTATAITLELVKVDDESNNATIEEIKKVLAEPQFEGNQYHLIGGVPIWVEMNHISRRESGTFVTINIFIIFLLLLIIFRRLRFAFSPILIAIISTVWAMSLYAIDNTLNMVSTIMPLIILVISIADCVHILSQYRVERKFGMTPKEAVHQTLSKLCLPCLFTSLTTAVAFLAFLLSSIPPLVALGFYTALGVLIAYLLSFAFLPSLLLIVDSPDKGLIGTTAYSWPRRCLHELPQWIMRHKNRIIFCSAVILIVSLLGVFQIRFQTDQIRYLKSSNPIRQASDLSQLWFDGIYPLEIVLTSDRKNYFNRVEGLKIVQKIEQRISKEELVKTIFSPVTFLEQFYRTLLDKQEQELSSSEMTMGLNLVLSSNIDSLLKYLSPDGDKLRIAVRSKWLDNQQLDGLVQRLKNSIVPLCEKEGLSIYFTGFSIMFANLNDRLIKSQINSFMISFLLIFIMILLFTRNWMLSTLGMIPNVLPVFTTLGIIGFLGVKLDVATVLIAAISLGIAVDDTIHLIHAIISNQKQGKRIPDSLSIAIQHVGRPLVLTSGILIGGFSVMMFSNFLPLVYFGAFVSLNVLFAILYDIILLPALLNFLHVRKQCNG
jgi:predicted RND superfamily exporter protein